jgi:hypothetical protein
VVGADLPSLSDYASDGATDELVRELTAPRASRALEETERFIEELELTRHVPPLH